MDFAVSAVLPFTKIDNNGTIFYALHHEIKPNYEDMAAYSILAGSSIITT